TTTGDFPGTNRLEITLDRAKLICEGGELIVTELERGTQDNTDHSEQGFDRIANKTYKAELDGHNEQHVEVLNKFAGAILHGTPLTAKGQEGINGLMISNAAFLSSWLGKTVELPVDEDLYYEKLQEKIQNSTFRKEVKEQVNQDMSSTY
ncbi:MAG: gfo/Idh/MocA family oxidoreductase, partial [Clostridia bacterium]|nr:gfo/Idh/MocA family oxidoreductase [Clostridia bacterium]